MKRLIFILIILFVILYFQYLSINNIPNDFTILQYKNPNKDMIEKILFEKKITIFTDLEIPNIIYKNNPILMITPKLYKIMNKSQHTEVLKILKTFFEYYYLPMNIKSDISLNYEKHNTRSKLIYQEHYRFGISQFLGLRKLFLFPPNSIDYLYYEKKKDNYKVNFWEQDTVTYPNIIKAKYIEIRLYPGQLIFIPYKWTYCYEIVENSMSVSFYSESVFSNILKK